jgi:hypothetical protein
MTAPVKLPFLTGFCGYSLLHERCPAVVAGVDCTCACHSPEVQAAPVLQIVPDQPTTQAPDLGDVLTTLTDTVRLLGEALLAFDGTPVELCDLLGRIRTQRQTLAESESLVERDAARAMRTAGIDVLEWEGGTAERRGGKDRKEWDHDAVTSAVTRAIIPPLAVDQNGEVDEDLAGLLHQAVEQYAATNRPSWRVTALKPLGVDPDDYCHAVPGRATVQVNLAGGAA